MPKKTTELEKLLTKHSTESTIKKEILDYQDLLYDEKRNASDKYKQYKILQEKEVINADIKQELYKITEEQFMEYKKTELSNDFKGKRHGEYHKDIQAIIAFLKDERHRSWQESEEIAKHWKKVISWITTLITNHISDDDKKHPFDKDNTNTILPYIGLWCDASYESNQQKNARSIEKAQDARHKEFKGFLKDCFESYMDTKKNGISILPIQNNKKVIFTLQELAEIIRISKSERILYYTAREVKHIIKEHTVDEDRRDAVCLYTHIARYNREYINDDFWQVITDQLKPKLDKTLQSLDGTNTRDTGIKHIKKSWDELLKNLPKTNENPFGLDRDIESYSKQLQGNENSQPWLFHTKSKKRGNKGSTHHRSTKDKKPHTKKNAVQQACVVFVGAFIGSLCSVAIFFICLNEVAGFQQLSKSLQITIGAALLITCFILGAGIGNSCYSFSQPSSSMQEPNVRSEEEKKL